MLKKLVLKHSFQQVCLLGYKKMYELKASKIK